MIPAPTAVLEDIRTGKTKPIPTTAFALTTIGTVPTIRVQCDRASVPAMRMTILDGVTGAVVQTKLDTNWPFRAMDDSKPLVLGPGSYRFTATPSDLAGHAIGSTLAVAFVISGANTGNTPSSFGLASWPAFGACTDYGTLATMAPKAAALGVTHLRSFCPGIATGGKYGTDHIDDVRAMRKASPATKFIGLHGMKQGCGYVASLDDHKRYFDVHFAAVAEFGAFYETELNNEIQLADYWATADPKDGSKIVVASIKAAAAVAKAARQCAGKGPKIIGPSVGWGASAAPHLAVWKILVEEGILDAIDAVNTHAYPYGGAAQLEEQIGGIAALAPGKPMYVTEINVHMHWTPGTTKDPTTVPIASVPAATTSYAAVVQKHNVVPFLFRLMPRPGDPHWSDDRSLYKADGTVNAPIAKGWGLKVAA